MYSKRFSFIAVSVTWLTAGSLLMVGCSARDQITPVASTSTSVDLNSQTVSLYGYTSSSTLTAGGYAYVYAQGGTAPYTFSIAEGDATVNSTSGYVQLNSTGNVVVLVRDAAGASYQVQLAVSSTTSTTASSCVYLSSKTQEVSSQTQSVVDLGAYAYMDKHVLVGLGLRIDNHTLMGIYSKVAKLNADGSISTTDAYYYKTGDLGSTAKGEIYIDLPAGYYLTGVGFAPNAAGSDVEAVKLYGDKVDATGSIVGSVQCAVDHESQLCTSASIDLSSKSYYSRYSEFRYGSGKPIVSWGAWINNVVVGGVSLATKTIAASTTASGLCPQ